MYLIWCISRQKKCSVLLTWKMEPMISILPMTTSTGSCASIWPIAVNFSSTDSAPCMQNDLFMFEFSELISTDNAKVLNLLAQYDVHKVFELRNQYVNNYVWYVMLSNICICVLALNCNIMLLLISIIYYHYWISTIIVANCIIFSRLRAWSGPSYKMIYFQFSTYI